MNLTGIWRGETVYINPRQAAKKEKADGEDAQHLFLPIEQYAAYIYWYHTEGISWLSRMM